MTDKRIAIMDEAGEIIRFDLVVDPDYAPDEPWCEAADDWTVGGVVTGSVYSAPPTQPAPVPASISRRQLLLGLTGLSLITGEEALAAAQTGAVPAAIDVFFGNLPPDQELAARITWASMSICEREHPLVAALAAANNLSTEDIDDAFRAWSQL